MISFEALRECGCWWGDPWWESPQNRSHSPLSIAEIQQRIGTLKQHFNEQWVRKALARDPAHPVVRYFWGATGTHPFDDLMWIGALMTEAAPTKGLPGKVAELIEQDALATQFEIQVAAVLAAGGWPVRFISRVKESKTPDLVADMLGIPVAIECKRLGREAWEQWVMKLMVQTGKTLRRPHLAGWDVEVLFNPRLSELLMDDDAINQAMLAEIDDRISDLLASIDVARCPEIFHVAEVASLEAHKRVAGRPTPGIGGVEISGVARLRRVINNGVRRALPQLQAHVGSAIAVYCDTLPGQALLEVAMAGVVAADPEGTANLAAVAIVSPLNNNGAADRVWTNRKHRLPDLVAEIEQRFRLGFARVA
ncbi:MAG: hypothetical protein OSA97_07520 [Nevskia sp.]|nr:hypothetical protein [Nevskia sp.]